MATIGNQGEQKLANGETKEIIKENLKDSIELKSISSNSLIILPNYFYDADITHLVVLISGMLEQLISHNDQIPLTSENLTRFHSRATPSITVIDYLRRIVKYTSLEKSCLLITLLYIDRVCERLETFTVSSLTVHRFLITSITVSSKALCDSYCTNLHYAKVGGISIQELNTLEQEFLKLIDWRLTCSGKLLQHYYANLVIQNPQFSFDTEMNTINKDLNFNVDGDMDIDSDEIDSSSSISSDNEDNNNQHVNNYSSSEIDTQDQSISKIRVEKQL